jgi:hypothetical protein
MRRVSKKRAALNKAVKEWRRAIREEVGRCEFCLKPAHWETLDVHELVPAYARAKALDKRFAVLNAHRECHGTLEAMTIPWQLAYLLRARPQDFDMAAYYKLTGRVWPDEEDIQRKFEQLFRYG